MRALAAEFIGTFALVFVGCGAIANGFAPTAVALTFGLVIGVMVYALGPTSGAHFNPAVSVAFAVGRHAPWSRTSLYVTAQLLGAISGALALRATLGAHADLGVTQPAGSDLESFAWETALTFFLMLVILVAAIRIRASGPTASLMIGGAVALGALIGGPNSGASMNPARSVGPALASSELAHLWIYLSAPILGAVLASVAHPRLPPRFAPQRDAASS